jgi:hypothetical protein
MTVKALDAPMPTTATRAQVGTLAARPVDGGAAGQSRHILAPNLVIRILILTTEETEHSPT